MMIDEWKKLLELPNYAKLIRTNLLKNNAPSYELKCVSFEHMTKDSEDQQFSILL